MRALVAAALVAALPAQQIVSPATNARDAVLATKDGLTLPAGEFTVVELIEAVAGYLCRNYLFDHDEVGKVAGFRLQRPIALDALGSEEMLYALLASRGFAVLPIDELRGVFHVVPLMADRRSAPIANVPWRTPDEILRRPRLRELVLTIASVRNLDTNQLANALRAQFAQQGTWQPGTPTTCAAGPDTLLLFGYRDQLAPLLLVVQQLDRAAEPRTPAPAPTPTPNQELLARIADLERDLAALRAEMRAGGTKR